MESSADRLKKARQAAGYDTPADAARAFGWRLPTYYGHENGSRGLRKDAAVRYAKAFRVKAAWLLTGEGGEEQPQTPDQAQLIEMYDQMAPEKKELLLRLAREFEKKPPPQ